MERAELERELERLHEESWGWALACCARDPELAEEALQSAYVRILSGRARFAGRSSLKTWLFGVIRYAAMEEMRRRALWSARSVDVARAIDVADPADGAQRTVEQVEQRAALRLALESLSPRQRESLQLVFYHGMTIEEAAGVMQISTGAARTHYDRGKKTLAKRLSRKDR